MTEAVAKTDTDLPLHESLVVADLGRGASRAFLLEQVGGAFRFVAKAEGPTTADLPFEDVSVGWHQLLTQLEWDAGRRLTERDGLLMPQMERGDGVDGFVICSTLGEPIRVAVLEAGGGGVSPLLLEALKRACTRVYHVVAPNGNKDGGWVSAQAEALRRFRPEMVVLLVNGDQGAAMARVVQLARQVAMSPAAKTGAIARAVVIGDGAAQGQAFNAFGAKTKTRAVNPKDQSAAEIAAGIEQEVLDAYRARLATPDFQELSRDAIAPPMIRAHAVDLVNRYVARAFDRRVITIGIDDGTHIHWAKGDQGTLATLPHVDLGPAITGLTAREVTDAARWLPFAVTDDELVLWVLNRAVRPWTRPHHARDILIEQALTRQVARRGLAEIGRGQPMAVAGADLVIGGPWFARHNQPGAAALALLDSIDVVPDHGVLDLAIDQDGLMAAAGALGTVDPALASDVFEYDGLVHLGSAVVIGGATHDGDLACRGELHYESGEMTSFSVASGGLEVLPLRPGETASLVLRPERRFSVGGHPSGKSVTLANDRRIIGGSVGVIVDARGRSLGAGPATRHAKVKQWLDAVNGVVPSSVRRTSS